MYRANYYLTVEIKELYKQRDTHTHTHLIDVFFIIILLLMCANVHVCRIDSDLCAVQKEV